MWLKNNVFLIFHVWLATFKDIETKEKKKFFLM